jgi:hypothetical protein
MPVPSENCPPVNLREAKKLITLRLRDPQTDTRSFTRLMSIYGKLNPGWKRKSRRIENESGVDDMVLQLERQQRLKRAKVKV